MDASFQRLKYLFQRHQSGEATPAERRELMAIVRAGTHEKALQQLIDETMENADAGQPEKMNTPVLSEESAGRIFSRIVGTVPLPADKPPVRRIPAWIGWAAAAACILGVLVSLPYRTPRKRAAAIAASQLKKYDAAPGRTAAMLTLSNGQQIALDSTASDTIGRQGNMAVINLKGLLTYNATGGSAAQMVYNTLTTNAGNQYQLVLPDGSRIWLNAASSIRFPVSFSSKERSVEITGEAYFEIAADARRPFLVHYRDMTVQVLGTHFDVNAYADEQAVATTLLEGSVNVVRGSDHTLIAPGQQVQISGNSLKVLSNVNTDEIVAWKEDQFYFRRMDIRSIMRQISRWYNIKVDYEGGNIEELFYAKIPRSVPLSEVLNALSLTGKVHFKSGEKTVTVYP